MGRNLLVLTILLLPAIAGAEGTQTSTRSVEHCSLCGEPELLGALEALLDADADDVRIAAIKQLGQTGSSLGVAALRDAAKSKSGAVRAAAIEALAALNLTETLGDFLNASRDREPTVAIAAAKALGAFPLRRVRQRLNELAAPSKPNDVPIDLRTAAVEALLEHNTREAWAAATDARWGSPKLATLTASAADRNPPCNDCVEPTVTLALSSLLASDDGRTRRAALLEVGSLRPLSRGLTIFARFAGDDDNRVRTTAVQMIATSTLTRAADMLVGISARSPHRDVRIGAARALFTRPEPSAAERIVQIVRTADVDLAAVVLASLVASSTVSPEALDAAAIAAKTTTATRDIRQISLRLVAERKHRDAVVLLLATADSRHPHLAPAAEDLLRRHFPSEYEEFIRDRPSSSARGFLIGSSAVFGGTSFGLLGGIRDESVGLTLLSAGGGAVLGLGTAYLLTLDETFTAGQAGLYTTDGVWGLLGGLGIAMAIGGQDGESFGPKLGGALGTAAGAGIGLLTLGRQEWTLGDTGFINLAGAQAAAATLGFLLIPVSEEDTVRATGLVMLGGTLLGVLPATLITRNLSFEGDAAGQVAVTSAVGGWLGAWSTRLVAPDDDRLTQRTVGGALLGQSIGFLTSAIITQYAEIDAGGLAWGSSAGGALGTGIGLLAPDISTQTSAGIISGTTVLGAALAMYAVPDDPDLGAAFTGSAVLGWFGGFLPAIYGDFSRDTMSREVAGGVLAGSAAGLLGSAVLFGDGRLSDSHKSLSIIGTVAGSGIGAGATLLASDNDQTVFRVLEGVGFAGFLGGAFGLSHLDITEGDRTAAVVATGYGTLAGLLLPDVINESERRERRRWGGALLLSSAFGLGTLTASGLIDPDPGDGIEIGLYAASGAAIGDGLLRILEADAQPTAIATLSASGVALATGLALAGNTKFDFDDKFYLAASSLTFATLGASLPYLRRDQAPPSRDVVAGIELGAGLGFAVGVLTHTALELEAGDIAETTLFTGAGGALGLGVGLLIPDSSKPVTAALYQGGAVAFGTAALLLSKSTDYNTLTGSTVAVLTAYGAWSGAWLPYLYNDGAPPGEQVAGGLLAGAGAGAATGVLLTQVFDLEPKNSDDVVETTLGGSAANMVGAGIGLIASEDNTPVVALMEGIGLAGTIGIAALAPSTDFSSGDTALGLLITSQALWNGLGAAFLLDATDRQIAGFALTAAGIGGIGGAAVSQLVDQSATTAMLSFTGSVWGTWLGYFGAKLAQDAGLDLSDTGVLGTTIVASDLGLALSALAFSPFVDMQPARVGWINLSGVGGALVGSTVGLVAGGVDGVNPGNVIGSVTGLIGSAIVTTFVEFEKPEPPAQARTEAPTTQRWTAILPDVSDVAVGPMVLPPVGDTAPPMVLSVSGRFL